MTSTLAIRVNSLCRRRGLRWVLVHINFELESGASLLIAGGNGAGKSTLLRLLSTLLPPSQGELELFGQSLPAGRGEIRCKIGFLAHDNQLYLELTPDDHLRLWSRLADKAIPTDLLKTVGLENRSMEAVQNFSAGMRKRLALARLLLLDPQLVLLDEPFGQLDAAGVELMKTTIKDWKEAGKTVVLATHLLDLGKSLCDRALLLQHGSLAWQGPASELDLAQAAGATS
ncbi:MAG: heme ABC exporter ATP-binding protein CcmA [Myxococcota bacterium]|nr:heme ABC exporter ATP-binding protein CcmA [Myxococcota bacterium]